MTLIEVAIAGIILGTVLSAFMSLIHYLGKSARTVRIMAAEDRMVASLVTNIRGNLRNYQASFEPVAASGSDPATEKALQSMPWAFSENDLVPATRCPTCPGRMGYVLQPLATMPGMFMVTMRIKHAELFGKDATKQYRFVATFR